MRTVYPRACGGTVIPRCARPVCKGLSPRLRGNPLETPHRPRSGWSIPAPAGEPTGPQSSECRCRVYPRACGGTLRYGLLKPLHLGLSPRLRGNRRAGRLRREYQGSIPAPAGEPTSTARCTASTTVYPRACGGTLGGRESGQLRMGLSPRLRGNLAGIGIILNIERSIPAPAGEPGTLSAAGARCPVYPRACGGTVVSFLPHVILVGLSPRLRGNPEGGLKTSGLSRSIPAPAGEPGVIHALIISITVYPRACGGTELEPVSPPTVEGLSPRLRGNRTSSMSSHLGLGSIPAPAGEPCPVRRCLAVSSVYPRACGGTHPRLGSKGQLGVYPRACGGTGLNRAGWLQAPGLSPRLRGNHILTTVAAATSGSIPAPAGEPGSRGGISKLERVYPRACGGTISSLDSPLMEMGLSPRLRGNRPAGHT